MKKNIGKADRSNRVFMIVLLSLGAYFTAGWIRYTLGIVAVYEIYTVLSGNCLVYQMMKLSSADNQQN
ncbi:MAG: DUF2892 domain-containing protein [Candidatus Falkowbacteria bacterium]